MHYLIGCHAVHLAKGHGAHLTPALVHINVLMFLLHFGFLSTCNHITRSLKTEALGSVLKPSLCVVTPLCVSRNR